MKKTLLITYYFPPKVGGGEEYLYNIYKRLPAEKVVVLAPGQSSEFDNQQNFKIYRTNFFAGKFKPAWWPMIKFVKKILKKEKIEIIHFGHYAHYILLARLLKISYLTFIQGTDLSAYSNSKLSRWLMRSNLRKAKLIVVNSHFLENSVTSLGINEKRVKVVHPGLDLAKYDFVNPRARYDMKDGKIILSVGRLHKVKGFDLVIKSLPEVLKPVPNATYFIVGDGEEKENLQKLVNELSLNNKVIFIGEIRDKKELSKYYAKADVYVGPSRHEGFGLSFLEARAFGLPIIATNVGGIPEAVENRGVLIEPENVEALTNVIVAALNSSKKYQPDRNFDWDKKIDEIKNILKI